MNIKKLFQNLKMVFRSVVVDGASDSLATNARQVVAGRCNLACYNLEFLAGLPPQITSQNHDRV